MSDNIPMTKITHAMAAWVRPGSFHNKATITGTRAHRNTVMVFGRFQKPLDLNHAGMGNDRAAPQRETGRVSRKCA